MRALPYRVGLSALAFFWLKKAKKRAQTIATIPNADLFLISGLEK